MGHGGSFISPQSQTHRPKAVLSLLFDILPHRDKHPPYMHLLERTPGGVARALVAGQGAGDRTGILSSERGPG